MGGTPRAARRAQRRWPRALRSISSAEHEGPYGFSAEEAERRASEQQQHRSSVSASVLGEREHYACESDPEHDVIRRRVAGSGPKSCRYGRHAHRVRHSAQSAATSPVRPSSSWECGHASLCVPAVQASRLVEDDVDAVRVRAAPPRCLFVRRKEATWPFPNADPRAQRSPERLTGGVPAHACFSLTRGNTIGIRSLLLSDFGSGSLRVPLLSARCPPPARG